VAVVQYTFTQKQYIEKHGNNRTTQITTNLEECGPCPVFASFTLAFALQLRKNLSQGSRSGLLQKQSTVSGTVFTVGPIPVIWSFLCIKIHGGGVPWDKLAAA
jgi:hypothetical protein